MVPPKRLIVLSYHFPPERAVGGLRWAGLSKHLGRRGWEVTVLTASESAALPGDDRVRIEVCRRGTTFNDWYRGFARTWRSRQEVAAGAGDGESSNGHATIESATRAGVIGTLRSHLSAWLAFPDFGRGWILRGASRARSLIQQLCPDVVVSSSPPHSVHLAALLATAGTPVRWLADLRDPWVFPDGRAPRWDGVGQSAPGAWALPKLERLTLARADAITTTAQELVPLLAERYPHVPVTCIPNGIDLDRVRVYVGDRFPQLGIAYVGTLYGERSLDPILAALRRFLDRHPEAAGTTKLRVAGDADPSHAAELERGIRAHDLGSAVERLGVVSPEDAVRLVGRSQLSLVLAQRQPLCIPAKIYECLGLGTAALVLAETESATWREAQRVGAHAVEPHDVEGVVRVLDELWAAGGAPVTPRVAIDYDAISEHMDAMLSRLLPGATRSVKAQAG